MRNQTDASAISFRAAAYWKRVLATGEYVADVLWIRTKLRLLDDDDEAGEIRSPCHVQEWLADTVALPRVTDDDVEGWTVEVGGWRGYAIDGPPPPHVVAAVADAYELPTTIQGAHDECAFLRWKSYMRSASVGAYAEDAAAAHLTEAALTEPDLDPLALARYHVVEELLLYELPATTTGEIMMRVRMLDAMVEPDERLVAAVERDLGALSTAPTRSKRTSVPRITDAGPVADSKIPDDGARSGDVPIKRGRPPAPVNLEIEAALRQDASRPNPALATVFNVSTATVSRIRRMIGLSDAPRTVTRGGQCFIMTKMPGKHRRRQVDARDPDQMDLIEFVAG